MTCVNAIPAGLFIDPDFTCPVSDSLSEDEQRSSGLSDIPELPADKEDELDEDLVAKQQRPDEGSIEDLLRDSEDEELAGNRPIITQQAYHVTLEPTLSSRGPLLSRTSVRVSDSFTNSYTVTAPIDRIDDLSARSSCTFAQLRTSEPGNLAREMDVAQTLHAQPVSNEDLRRALELSDDVYKSHTNDKELESNQDGDDSGITVDSRLDSGSDTKNDVIPEVGQ